jgi:hypothetical protein
LGQKQPLKYAQILSFERLVLGRSGHSPLIGNESRGEWPVSAQRNPGQIAFQDLIEIFLTPFDSSIRWLAIDQTELDS